MSISFFSTEKQALEIYYLKTKNNDKELKKKLKPEAAATA